MASARDVSHQNQAYSAPQRLPPERRATLAFLRNPDASEKVHAAEFLTPGVFSCDTVGELKFFVPKPVQGVVLNEQTGRYNGVTNNGLHRELQRSIFFARMARGEEEPSPAFLASKSCHWVKSIMTMSAEDPVYCKSKPINVKPDRYEPYNAERLGPNTFVGLNGTTCLTSLVWAFRKARVRWAAAQGNGFLDKLLEIGGGDLDLACKAIVWAMKDDDGFNVSIRRASVNSEGRTYLIELFACFNGNSSALCLSPTVIKQLNLGALKMKQGVLLEVKVSLVVRTPSGSSLAPFMGCINDAQVLAKWDIVV